MKRAGTLGALIATVFLTIMLPGLWRDFLQRDTNRMEESLRPAKSRTLTLWVLSPGMDDYRLLCRMISAYEKEQPGLRVYLRSADASELCSEGVVLPDGVFYAPGDITTPESWFLPLVSSATEENHSAGRSGGVQYGFPLWYAPSVLSLPMEWLRNEASSAGFGGQSYFGKATPAPFGNPLEPSPETLPWERILEPGKLFLSPGTASLQLMLYCPESRRNALASMESTPKALPETARLWTYPDHLRASGTEALTAIPLCPAAGDQVRFFSLCKQGAEAQALLDYLSSPERYSLLEDNGLLSASNGHQPKEGFLARMRTLYPGTVYFPNAYSHTAAERETLCGSVFRSGQDPTAALLSLR